MLKRLCPPDIALSTRYIQDSGQQPAMMHCGSNNLPGSEEEA
jgi:hypothetical protein